MDNNNEIWRTHPAFSKYQISTFGKVRSITYNKIMKQFDDKDGYKYIFLRNDEGTKTIRKQVHRLVAETFIPNNSNFEFVCHKTKSKYSNKLKDIFWCNCKRKMSNAFERGFFPSVRTKRKERVTLTELQKDNVLFLLSNGYSYNQLASMYNISQTLVWKIKKKHIKK